MRQAPDERPTQARRPAVQIVELDHVFGSDAPSGHGDIRSVPASAVIDAIDEWIGAGGVISFSMTSDGGAISIALGSGAWRKKLYGASPDEIVFALQRVSEGAKALAAPSHSA